jgi:uncharacterized UPF0146 family protein
MIQGGSSLNQQWITCSSTNELVAAVARCITPNDRVAELGAQLRDVSTSICKASSHAVLVDVERKFPKNTKQPHRSRAMRLPGEEATFFPNKATFLEINKLDDWRKAFLSASSSYDVLVLDVNAIVGNDLEWTSLAIMREFTALFDCHTILVKSHSLNQWAARLVHGKRWIAAKGITNVQPPNIVATVGVDEYRKTIPFTVQPEDSVLEVGCHFGTSTVLLDAAADTCLGVDVGSKIIREAKKRHPLVDFSVGDAWKTAQLARFGSFDVIYIDVGGLSGRDGLFEALALLSALMYALEPRSIVIKSLCVQRLSSTLIPWWQQSKQVNT